MPKMLKKNPISVKLPRWLIDWMATQPRSRAVLIEEALCARHKLKPPVIERDENEDGSNA